MKAYTSHRYKEIWKQKNEFNITERQMFSHDVQINILTDEELDLQERIAFGAGYAARIEKLTPLDGWNRYKNKE